MTYTEQLQIKKGSFTPQTTYTNRTLCILTSNHFVWSTVRNLISKFQEKEKSVNNSAVLLHESQLLKFYYYGKIPSVSNDATTTFYRNVLGNHTLYVSESVNPSSRILSGSFCPPAIWGSHIQNKYSNNFL